MKKILFMGTMELLFIVMMVLIAIVAQSQNVPTTVSFQGYLSDKTTGDPLNGNFDMRFSLFDANSGGTELWFDDYSAVPVSKGLYTVILGDKKPISLAFNQPYYLQMKVGLETLDTRLTLTSSGYSISSTNASNLTMGTIPNGRLDAELQDLADGTLSGSLVGAGVSAANISGTLAVTNGGTGTNTLTGVAIGNGSGTMSAVAKTGGTQYFRSNPANTGYEFVALSLANADISASAAIAGSKVVPAFGAQNISTTGTITGGSLSGTLAASNISGTLPVGSGGTGATTLTGVLFGNGASTVTALSTGSPTTYLRRNAANNAYEFGTIVVSTNEITDNTISDVDISPAASITGTKINTDFGSKNIVTTGSITATSLSGTLSAASLTGANNLPVGVLPATVPIGNGAANRLTFWTGAGTVTSNSSLNWDNTNSRLGVGTATPGTSLHVLHGNGVGSNGITIESSAVASSNWNFYVSSSGDLWFLKAGSQKGTFNGTSGAYTSTSDRRLKKDIEPIGDVTADVMKLSPYSYRFKEQPASEDKSIGFMAQDVMKLFPSLVKHNEETDIYTLDYSGFGVLAVKAIQEQQKKIDDLSNEIMELKRAVEILQSNLKK
jgi:hypothetical protein